MFYRLLTIALVVCLPWVAMAQDVLTVTDTGGQIATVVYEWTSDGSGDATGRTSVVLPGILWGAVCQPGSGGTQPSDNYDVVVYQVFSALGGGVDVLSTDLVGGALADRSNAAPVYAGFWPGNVYNVQGMVQIVVSNAGALKTGRVELAVARHLAIKSTAIGMVGGTTGQVLQWSAPGLALPVTISGDGTVATGGALTLGPTAISGLGAVTAVSGDYLWLWDATDSALKKVDVSGLAGSGTVTSVAVSGSDGLEVDSGSPITGSGTIALGVNKAGMLTFLNVEDGATADQSDGEIEAAYNNQVALVGQAEAEAGVASTRRGWTALRVAQAIAALETGPVTHTGDVEGSTALTIVAGAVDEAMTSITGTPDGTLYLRDDWTWVAPPVTLTNTATLTNKTVTKRVVALSDAATILVDTTGSGGFYIGTVTIAGNRTLGADTGTPTNGQGLILRVKQDGTGSRTLTFASGTGGYKFGAIPASPTLSAAAGTTDVLGFLYDSGTSMWWFVAFATEFS